MYDCYLGHASVGSVALQFEATKSVGVDNVSRIDTVVDGHSSIVQELLTKLSYALTSLEV